MMSGVARHRVRSFFFWRMISWPAAKGIKWVKPARYAVSPSRTNLETASFIGMTFWGSMGSRPPPRADQGERVDPAEALVGRFRGVGSRQRALAQKIDAGVLRPQLLALVTDE